MASLDGKIREALRSTVAAAATGAKSVVTYQAGAFDNDDDLPAILVEVGQWTQIPNGSGNIPGQRAYLRQYAVAICCIANTTRAAFAETVNAMGDKALAALSRWRDIPGVHFEDLSFTSASYDRYGSEEGSMGMLALEGTAEVIVNEAFPDVAQGPDDPVSAFTLHPGAF